MLFEQLILPGVIRRSRISLWVGTCNTLPLTTRSKSILLLQSHQFLSVPEAYTRLQRAYLRFMVRSSVKKADRVVTFSEASRAVLTEQLDVSPEKIRVLYHGVPEPIAAEAENRVKRNGCHAYDLDQETIVLCVSSFYPYKNHRRLIQAFAQVAESFPHAKLYLAGAETPLVRLAELKEFSHAMGVSDRVVFLGLTSHERLVELYQHASALVMPSLDETCGLPILEAMAFGCPVITSNLGSMAEIATGSAVLVDPFSVESIANGIISVLSSPELCEKLSAAGLSRAKMFTMDRFLTQLAGLIDELS